VGWSLVVWVFGEAFGAIFAPGLSFLTGAPGAPRTPYEAVILLQINCQRRPLVKLHLYGLSPDSVTAQPPRLDFEPLGQNETGVPRVITLTRAMGPFKLLGVTASDPRLGVTSEMDPSGRFAQLVVTFQPGRQRGAIHGTLTVRTDDPERPRFTIPVTSEVVRATSVTTAPATVDEAVASLAGATGVAKVLAGGTEPGAGPGGAAGARLHPRPAQRPATGGRVMSWRADDRRRSGNICQAHA